MPEQSHAANEPADHVGGLVPSPAFPDPAELAPETLAQVHAWFAAAAPNEALGFVRRLAAELEDAPDGPDGITGGAVDPDEVEEWAEEFAALPDCPHCGGTGKDVPPGWPGGQPRGDSTC